MCLRATGSHDQGLDEEITTAYDASKVATWHVQVAAGDVRVVSREVLHELLRQGVVSPSSFAWRPGMTHWVQLQTLLEASRKKESTELFSVQVGSGNIKQLTPEQLDDFYRCGVIDEGTRIWQPGMPRWRTLGSVAGIDDEAPTKLHRVPVQLLAVPVRSPTPPQPVVAPRVSPPARRPAIPPPFQCRPVAVSIDAELDAGFDAAAVPIKSVRPALPIQSAQAIVLPLAGTQGAARPPTPQSSRRAVSEQPGRAAAAPAHDTRSRTVPTQSVRMPVPSPGYRPAAAVPAPNGRLGASVSAYDGGPPARSATQVPLTAWPGTAPMQGDRGVGSIQSARPGVVPPQLPWPAPISFRSPYEHRQRGRGARWLLWFALISGGMFALYRNDVIHSVAQRTPFASAYAQRERTQRMNRATALGQPPLAAVQSTRTLGDVKSSTGESEVLPKDERALIGSTPAVSEITPSSPRQGSATPGSVIARVTTAPKPTTAVRRHVLARRRAGATTAQGVAKSFNEEVEAAMLSASATTTPRRKGADSAASTPKPTAASSPAKPANSPTSAAAGATSAKKSEESESAPRTPKRRAQSALLEHIAAAVRAQATTRGSASNKSGATNTPAR